MNTLLDIHTYTDDGNGRCTHCGLGRDQGRGARAHTLPDIPDARAIDDRIIGEGTEQTPSQTPDAPTTTPTRFGLNWSGAGYTSIGKPAPCADCGHPAIMRDPATMKARHKVCAERALAKSVAANTAGTR